MWKWFIGACLVLAFIGNLSEDESDSESDSKPKSASVKNASKAKPKPKLTSRPLNPATLRAMHKALDDTSAKWLSATCRSRSCTVKLITESVLECPRLEPKSSSVRIYEGFFDHRQLRALNLQYFIDQERTDVYGRKQSRRIPLANIGMTRAVWNRVDPDGFDFQDLPKIAPTYQELPCD